MLLARGAGGRVRGVIWWGAGVVGSATGEISVPGGAQRWCRDSGEVG